MVEDRWYYCSAIINWCGPACESKTELKLACNFVSGSFGGAYISLKQKHMQVLVLFFVLNVDAPWTPA